MKAIRTIFFSLFLSSQVLAQPGPDVVFPTNINLNQYPSFPREFDEDSIADDFSRPILGIITIDSTSDLSIIPLLKKEKNLALKIDLFNIPSEFTAFENTKSLRLIDLKDSINISFINAFRNLKYLYLENSGDIIFNNYLSLDSLVEIDISFSERLTSLKALEKINSLEKISLRYVPKLKEFPEFDPNNRINYVHIYQEIGDGCTDCLPSSHKLNITGLNRLKQLEVLVMSNVNGLTEIPGDLSKELRVFQIIDIQRANKDYAIRSYIQDVSGFSNYEKLETINLSGVHIKAFKGNFEKLNLKYLTFSNVYGLEDISGIFTMKSIDQVKIELCGIRTIDGSSCNASINKMIFSDCSNIEKIDFLLSCEHINHLQLGGGSMLLLPKPKKWKIPNLNIYAHGAAGKFYVMKKEGEIVDSLNLNPYVK